MIEEPETPEMPDTDGEYPEISESEVINAAEHDPTRAAFMLLANEVSAESKERRLWKPRERKLRQSGWYITLHNGLEQSAVGLWSCWLGDQFFLGYPKNAPSMTTHLSPEQVLKIANDYRSKHPGDFVIPQNEPWDYGKSIGFLMGLEKDNLFELFRKYKINIPQAGDIDIPDELIIKTLGVERAKPVRDTQAIAVSPGYRGEYKDYDKPLERNECGQTIAYQDKGLHQFGEFFGPILEEGGRVWINKGGFNSNCHVMPFIKKGGELEKIAFGWEKSRNISTFPFSRFSNYSPESPTTDPKAIQRYRDKFIQLLVETSLIYGLPTAISIDYNFAMIPEDLEREDYQNIRWLKGQPGERRGWGDEIVRAEKTGEIVFLKSGNSLVPWSTIRHLSIPEKRRNPKDIYEMVQESLTF